MFCRLAIENWNSSIHWFWSGTAWQKKFYEKTMYSGLTNLIINLGRLLQIKVVLSVIDREISAFWGTISFVTQVRLGCHLPADKKASPSKRPQCMRSRYQASVDHLRRTSHFQELYYVLMLITGKKIHFELMGHCCNQVPDLALKPISKPSVWHCWVWSY